MTDKTIFQLSPAKNPFLGNLPAAAMEELMNLGKVQRLTDGEPFIREGDPSDSIYFVSFGEVAVLKGGVEIDTMRTGGVIGEMGVFKGVPRSATIKCKNQPSAAHAQTGKAASHGAFSRRAWVAMASAQAAVARARREPGRASRASRLRCSAVQSSRF